MKHTGILRHGLVGLLLAVSAQSQDMAGFDSLFQEGPLTTANVTQSPTQANSTDTNMTEAPTNMTTMEPSMDFNETEAPTNMTDVDMDMNMTMAPSETPTAPGTPVSSVPDTTEVVLFNFTYGFANGTAREPTQTEVEELVCQTTLWIRDQVREGEDDDTVQVFAQYIDWWFIPDSIQPIHVMFMGNTTYNYTEPVSAASVGEYTGVEDPSIIVDYIQNYVFEVPETSIFQDIVNAGFDAVAYAPIPYGKLEDASCPITVPPTFAPTMSAAPTTSAAPTMAPTVSAAPTTSAAPTGAPTTPPPFAGTATDPPGPAPTTASSNTPAPVPVGATRQNINARFIVSNLIDMIQPADVNASGLNAAWIPFVEDVVTKTAAEREQSGRRQLRERQQGRRQLRVEYEQGSAYIYDIILKEDCGDGTHPDSTCHDAYGTYSILLYDDDRERPRVQEQVYGRATVDAINGGDLQDSLDEVDPDSPLYIGTVSAPKDGGMPIWLLILIILLCILLCCCLLGLLFFLFMNRDRDGEQKSEPYDEEGFVYDFLIPPHQKVQTEVDDEVGDDETKDVDDELFEDEDGDVVAARAVGDDDDAAPATKMEEDDEEEEFEDDDDEVNVTAEVEDEDEAEVEEDEEEPMVAGDDAEEEDEEPQEEEDEDELVEISNDAEESGHEEEGGEEDAEDWDDEGEENAEEGGEDEEDWDDEGEEGEGEEDGEENWDDGEEGEGEGEAEGDEDEWDDEDGEAEE